MSNKQQERKKVSKHINLILEPDQFREVAICFATLANPDETKKQFYARALVVGAKELNKNQTKVKK